MSTETRLARLRLLHLKDKPEELERCLERILIEIQHELARHRTKHIPTDLRRQPAKRGPSGQD
jgi:hypothetical protein